MLSDAVSDITNKVREMRRERLLSRNLRKSPAPTKDGGNLTITPKGLTLKQDIVLFYREVHDRFSCSKMYIIVINI